jgi:hypothetical protein
MRNHLQCFMSRYYTDGDNPSRFDCMFHLSPREVVCSALYRAWMRRFGQSVNHVFLGPGAAEPASPFVASTRHVRKLHTHAPALFPRLLLKDDVSLGESPEEQALPTCAAGYPLMRYVLGPSSQRGWSGVAPVYPSDAELDEDVSRHVSDLMSGRHAEAYRAAVQALTADRESCLPAASPAPSPSFPLAEGDYCSAAVNEALLQGHKDNEIWFLGKKPHASLLLSQITCACVFF